MSPLPLSKWCCQGTGLILRILQDFFNAGGSDPDQMNVMLLRGHETIKVHHFGAVASNKRPYFPSAQN